MPPFVKYKPKLFTILVRIVHNFAAVGKANIQKAMFFVTACID
ncbi:hypothetical protein X781_5870 [Mannheimia sp. USDA-ARS-USMARC-1261]|nr:hypothetical protein X781_5870 [Mannheimia sp. USDA-ARS-USMARC-1261]